MCDDITSVNYIHEDTGSREDHRAGHDINGHHPSPWFHSHCIFNAFDCWNMELGRLCAWNIHLLPLPLYAYILYFHTIDPVPKLCGATWKYYNTPMVSAIKTDCVRWASLKRNQILWHGIIIIIIILQAFRLFNPLSNTLYVALDRAMQWNFGRVENAHNKVQRGDTWKTSPPAAIAAPFYILLAWTHTTDAANKCNSEFFPLSFKLSPIAIFRRCCYLAK